MTTDKELLEKAARAAGIAYTNPYCNSEYWFVRPGCEFEEWLPLVDDGDALRLAVKLNMQVSVEGDCVYAACNPEGLNFSSFEKGEATGSDPYAATRRAIVRAAAEMAGE